MTPSDYGNQFVGHMFFTLLWIMCLCGVYWKWGKRE